MIQYYFFFPGGFFFTVFVILTPCIWIKFRCYFFSNRLVIIDIWLEFLWDRKHHSIHPLNLLPASFPVEGHCDSGANPRQQRVTPENQGTPSTGCQSIVEESNRKQNYVFLYENFFAQELKRGRVNTEAVGHSAHSFGTDPK